MEIVLRDTEIPGIESLPYTGKTENKRQLREAVRAVAYDPETDSVVLVHSDRYGRYELPGGGMEPGETPEQTLARELREETGVTGYEILARLPDVREHYDRIIIDGRPLELLHHAYLVRITEPVGEPSPTEEEIRDGFAPVLVPVELALDIMDTETGESYESRYVWHRSRLLLAETLDSLHSRET